jgi:hypothetical protein
MLFFVLMLFLATFSGTATGCLLSWWLLGQPSDEWGPVQWQVPVDRADLDDGVFDHAATQWASSHYRPEVALLVAGKLRLYDRLTQSRWPQ